MSKEKEAVEKFCDGFSCSQAVLTPYCDEHGLDPELAIKLASGFGGTMWTVLIMLEKEINW